MARPKKYNTSEEKKEAMKQFSKNWYHRHKNDPEYIKLTKFRYNKYRKGLKDTKEDFMREYNTDYVYYIRNVRTGKFQAKIFKAKETSANLIKNIKEMEKELDRLLNRFKHLENKKDDKEEDKSNVDKK